jgi:mTERF domain-containing protein
MKVLESRKLIEGDWNIATPLTISEKKFLLNYVTKYADKAPDLLQIYGGTDKSKRTHTL